ncbi:MAG: hypothetical protein EOM67_12615, partial [Spirochaetia bacterium]|nr:hypothetical protein [Spirochaetia bacterium]
VTGGPGVDARVLGTYGEQLDSLTSQSAPSKIGFTFNGYWDALTDGSQYYNTSMTSVTTWDKLDESAILYARWTALEYEITLIHNGGIGVGSTYITATYGSPMPPLIEPPTKPGSAFNGYWKINVDPQIQYYDGNGNSVRNWDNTYNTGIYGKWLYKSTLTLDPNGGEAGASSVDAVDTRSMPEGLEAPSRTGYAFEGYYDALTGGTQYYNGSMESTITWDNANTITTLYARWTAKPTYINFNSNGGLGGLGEYDIVLGTYGEPLYSLTSTSSPFKTGFTFNGYWDDPNGGTQYYNASRENVKNWDKEDAYATLYARWTGGDYTISLDPNTGTAGTTTSVIATYGSPMPSLADGPTMAGYAFDGYWDYIPTPTVQYYDQYRNSVRNWDMTNNYTLNAKWLPIVTVTLDQNGGSYGIGSVSNVVYTRSMPEVAGVPRRTGYVFDGYWNAAGDTQYYNSSLQSVHVWDSIYGGTLYAKWK